MKRGLLVALAIMAGLAAFLLTWLWRVRAALPYNSEGRYFDPTEAVVLHEQSVAIYAGLALTLWAIAGFAIWGAFRH